MPIPLILSLDNILKTKYKFLYHFTRISVHLHKSLKILLILPKEDVLKKLSARFSAVLLFSGGIRLWG